MNEILAVRTASPFSEAVDNSPAAFKLRSIDLYLTSVCNRRCSYCFLSDGFLTSRSQMSYDMAEEIIKWGEQSGLEEVTLLGGEPAFYPDFAKIVLAARLRGLQVRTVTNGSTKFRAALTDRSVAEAFSRVAVSIDSPRQEDFDRLRGQGSFADAIATTEELRRLEIRFDINCTVLRSCLNDFPEMLGFAEKLGARRLNVHWFSAVGRGEVHAAEESLTAIEWRDRVVSVVRDYRSPRDSYFVDCELAYDYGFKGQRPGACAVRDRENLQFFPDGSVFSCGMLVDRPWLSAYEWNDGKLMTRGGETELSRANACSGCAFRQADGGFTPLCIYNRLEPER